MKIKETELAKNVIAWLEDQKWDVYQEVQLYSGDRCADIVATFGHLLWVIECKTSNGLAVIEQALYWTRRANMVSIAVPKGNQFAKLVCRKFGIGYITAKHSVNEWSRPSIIRKSTAKFRSKLTDEHRTYAEAGNSDGIRWTPFKATCKNVLAVVKREPGISMKDLVNKAETHYASSASARICLAKWIDDGIVPGVEIRREGRKIKVFPKSESF